MSKNITHEIRITAADRTKVVQFCGGDAPAMWADLYNSCALVNGDEEPDQTNEDGVLVGTIHVRHSWKRVLHIIEEDAGLCVPATIAALTNPERTSIVSGP